MNNQKQNSSSIPYSMLKVEVNSNEIGDTNSFKVGGAVIMVTPNIDEDYWLMRVPLSEDQAVVCFPKFGTIGIGFQHEEDWNTNLPYTCDAEEIFNHIAHNKGNDAIDNETAIKAIRMLQDEINSLRVQQKGANYEPTIRNTITKKTRN